MYSPADQSIEEFYKHQEVLLPHTSPYLGKTNVDIGCGTGLTSIIHQQQIGISPTICDVADFRHPLARSLPFHLIHDEKLPFDDKSFESSYIQYVCWGAITDKQLEWSEAQNPRVRHEPEDG